MTIQVDDAWVERWSAIDPAASKEWSEALRTAYYDESVDGLLDPRLVARGANALRRVLGARFDAVATEEILRNYPSGAHDGSREMFDQHSSQLLSVIPEPARSVLERIPVVLFPGLRDVGTGCRLHPNGTRAFICIDAGYFGFLSRATSLTLERAWSRSNPDFDESLLAEEVVSTCSSMLQGHTEATTRSFLERYQEGTGSTSLIASTSMIDAQLRFILAHEYAHILCGHFQQELAAAEEGQREPKRPITASDLANARLRQVQEIEADSVALRLCNAVAEAGQGFGVATHMPHVGVLVLFLNLALLSHVGRAVVYRDRDPGFRKSFFDKLFVGSHPYPLFRLMDLRNTVFGLMSDLEAGLYNTYVEAQKEIMVFIAPAGAGAEDSQELLHVESSPPNPGAKQHARAKELIDLGHHSDALVRAREAVAYYRGLVDVDPLPEHRSELASSLDTVGVALSKMGRFSESLTATQESVELQRSLAGDHLDVHSVDLARMLNHLGLHLSQAGRPDRSVAPSQESIELFRELANKGLDEYLPSLAAGLDNLGIVFAQLERPEEGLEFGEEGAEIRRRLVVLDPAHEVDLARSLHNLGGLYGAAGRQEKAVAVYKESLALRTSLAREDDLPSIAELAESYGAQGKMRLDAGEPAEALELFSRGLERLTPHLPQVSSYPTLAYAVRGFLISARQCQQRGDAIDEAKFAIVLPAASALGMLPPD